MLHRRLQRRDITLNDDPHAVHVQPEIVMHHDIAEPRDRFPSNLRPQLLQLRRYALRRLSQRLQIPKHGIARLAFIEISSPSRHELLNRADAVKDVLEVYAIALEPCRAHNATASAMIRSRSGGAGLMVRRRPHAAPASPADPPPAHRGTTRGFRPPRQSENPHRCRHAHRPARTNRRRARVRPHAGARGAGWPRGAVAATGAVAG